MGLILKSLFSTSSTPQSKNKKTRGYSYDTSLPSNPPIKGRHPLSGNGPNLLNDKVIQASKLRYPSKSCTVRSSGSTLESNGVSLPDVPYILHKFDSRSTTSTIPKNLKLDRRRGSWENEIRCRRPATSASTSYQAIPRPKIGYIPEYHEKELRHLVSIPNNLTSMRRLHSVDLLDAHSSFFSSRKILEDREKANGVRSYGEDVADRNMAPELPTERMESPLDSRPLIDCPELKFLKEMHLANKRAIGMIDSEPDEPPITPPLKPLNENLITDNNQVKKNPHPHSHPLRSLLNTPNESRRPSTANAYVNTVRVRSVSKSSQYTLPLDKNAYVNTVRVRSVSKSSQYTLPLEKKAFTNEATSLRISSRSNIPSVDQTCPLIKQNSRKPVEVEKEAPSVTNSDQKIRRHTYSALVSYKLAVPQDQCDIDALPMLPTMSRPRKSFLLRPSSSSSKSVTIRPSSSSSKSFSSKVTDGSSYDDFIRQIKGSVITVGNHTGNCQHSNTKTEISSTNNPKYENIIDKNSLKDLLFTQKQTASAKSSVYADSIRPESKMGDVATITQMSDRSKNKQDQFKLKSRRSMSQNSSKFLPAQASTVQFLRCQSRRKSVNSCLVDNHILFDSVDDDDAAQPPSIAIKRDQRLANEKIKNNPLKPAALFKSVGNDRPCSILPSMKDYSQPKLLLAEQHEWQLRPLIDNMQGQLKCLESVNKNLDLRRIPSYHSYHSSSDEETYGSDPKILGPDEEGLLFGDNFGFNFSDILPGIQMMDSLPVTLSPVCQQS